MYSRGPRAREAHAPRWSTSQFCGVRWSAVEDHPICPTITNTIYNRRKPSAAAYVLRPTPAELDTS